MNKETERERENANTFTDTAKRKSILMRKWDLVFIIFVFVYFSSNCLSWKCDAF